MNSLPLSQAGELAASVPTSVFHFTFPVLASSAVALPLFGTTYRTPFASTGWNSISEPDL
jgi:hypothetical protein